MSLRVTAIAVVLTVSAAAPAAFAEEFRLSTGETIRGTVVERNEAVVILDHPVLGRLVIPVPQIVAAPETPAAPAAPAAPSAPEPAPPPPSPWKFRAELGASGSDGNTDQSDLRAAIGALYEDEARRFKASAAWLTSKTDGDKTKDQQYVEATHDWLFKDSPWSVFATGRMDWDEFQDWDRRATVGGGAGYLAVDDEDFKLRFRAGLVGTREWGSTDEDREDWRPEGLLGVEADWKINETNSIEAKSTYYPDFDDAGEYRLVSSAAWSVRLSKESSLSLKLGVEDEYDSHNENPFEKNDFRWFVALLYEF